MDIIGKLAIKYTLQGDQFDFEIDENASDTDLRAEFALANREVEAIKAKYGNDFPNEIADRIKVLQNYKKHIRSIVIKRVEAQQILNEDVDLPADEPARAAEPETPAPAEKPAEKPAAPTPAPAEPGSDDDDEDDDAKAKKPAAKRDTVKPDFIYDGDTIVDAHGNRYSRVAEPMDRKAAKLDANQLEAMAAAVKPAPTASPLLATIATDEEIDAKIAERAPLHASLGGFNAGQDDRGGQITAARAGHLLLAAAKSRPSQDTRTYLFQQDRFAPLQASLGLERIAGNTAVDALVAKKQAEHAEAMLAAFCGPGELNRDQRVAVNTARPVAQALASANGPVAIGLGIHEFFRAIGMADLVAHYAANPTAPIGLGQWNAADQAGVDVADPATWKGCFTLPACPGTVQVSAYFLWRCLRVTVEDQMSRPQYIDNITTLMEAMLARSAEAALLDTIDAWSFQRTVPNTPGYGAANQLFWAVEHAMAWAVSGNRVNRDNYAVIVPEFLLNMARIDAYFAGEDPNNVLDRVLEGAGGQVIVTPDWGSEGNPMAPMPVLPTPDAAAAGNGTDLPLMPTTAVIRVLALDDFVWGQTGVVDYGIETSPDLRRQNAALYFGEMAEIAYKNGGRPSFTLTLQDLVPNGARADRVAPFAVGTARPYNNTLPDALKAGLPAAQFQVV